MSFLSLFYRLKLLILINLNHGRRPLFELQENRSNKHSVRGILFPLQLKIVKEILYEQQYNPFPTTY